MIKSEKNMSDIRTETTQQNAKKKNMQRKAISVKCMSDQNPLNKNKEGPGSIKNILSNLE